MCSLCTNVIHAVKLFSAVRVRLSYVALLVGVCRCVADTGIFSIKWWILHIPLKSKLRLLVLRFRSSHFSSSFAFQYSLQGSTSHALLKGMVLFIHFY